MSTDSKPLLPRKAGATKSKRTSKAKPSAAGHVSAYLAAADSEAKSTAGHQEVELPADWREVFENAFPPEQQREWAKMGFWTAFEFLSLMTDLSTPPYISMVGANGIDFGRLAAERRDSEARRVLEWRLAGRAMEALRQKIRAAITTEQIKVWPDEETGNKACAAPKEWIRWWVSEGGESPHAFRGLLQPASGDDGLLRRIASDVEAIRDDLKTKETATQSLTTARATGNTPTPAGEHAEGKFTVSTTLKTFKDAANHLVKEYDKLKRKGLRTEDGKLKNATVARAMIDEWELLQQSFDLGEKRGERALRGYLGKLTQRGSRGREMYEMPSAEGK